MPIVYSSNPSFELPEEGHSLIEQAIVPADELNAKHSNTKKYFVDGHPDLFVRMIPGIGVKSAMIASDRLAQYGVQMLPYHVLEHNGEEWVITKNVTGFGLPDALRQDDSARTILNAADITWSGLVANLIDAKREGRFVPTDIEEPDQYMYGTIEFGANQNRMLYLVDLPQFAFPAKGLDFAETLLGIANGIVDVETSANSRIRAARSMIDLAVDHVDMNGDWSRQLALASQYVLDSGVKLHPADDAEAIRGLTAK